MRLLGLCLMLAAIGCSTDARKVNVSGKVTLDGNPLAEGQILFVSDQKDVPPEQGQIAQGTYTATLPAGPRTVQITAWRDSKKTNAVMGGAVKEQYIPAKFNEKSELKTTIPDQATFTADFTVTGK
ncbi:hypothetical protein [Tuwongella immobilis]|uniref:Carboxypeptidase regulatory-like domain-containing protein n=1 Tax=Tuwongella immobilis TaxID=692036 RepID=A0A6C2YHX2_9BACT|nr:hypothetical protein [Tuwongella immobilis]VIP01138.1 Uncharacterized protein OS=Blastopirellula marina DSM 3645 GN=DSM3645_30226 PE=4 SV=1 [Tuwongella immobilis]VTR97701.1 Uncharacterized protein OS=Blastopirellula marina DSM 3645 GN=DSM3645_30226 PE=4 SV=1 [Tuwongella immobilis]